jgi:hypothetical protein
VLTLSVHNTAYMMQSVSWEDDSCSADQNIFRFPRPGNSLLHLWEPATVPYYESLNSFHILSPYLCSINFNIILRSTAEAGSFRAAPWHFFECRYAILAFLTKTLVWNVWRSLTARQTCAVRTSENWQQLCSFKTGQNTKLLALALIRDNLISITHAIS